MLAPEPRAAPVVLRAHLEGRGVAVVLRTNKPQLVSALNCKTQQKEVASDLGDGDDGADPPRLEAEDRWSS